LLVFLRVSARWRSPAGWVPRPGRRSPGRGAETAIRLRPRPSGEAIRPCRWTPTRTA